jgi:hypothetical protein
MSILNKSFPTSFEVIVDDNSSQETIFSKRIYTKQWHDAELNLSRWQGKTINIILRTSGQPGSVALWSNPLVFQTTRKLSNVLIYLIDCLRADHVGIYGYHRNTTPNIDRFTR